MCGEPGPERGPDRVGNGDRSGEKDRETSKEEKEEKEKCAGRATLARDSPGVGYTRYVIRAYERAGA